MRKGINPSLFKLRVIVIGITMLAICGTSSGSSEPKASGARKDVNGFWQGVTKSLPTTSLGNVVATSCHNCYMGSGDKIYNATNANAKINNAISNGADLIEIDIAEFNGVIYAAHDEPWSSRDNPALDRLLDNNALLNSEAMLFLEVKERGLAPITFARLVLDMIKSRKTYAHKGRLIFFRSFSSNLAYLIAIRDALSSYPEIAPYVRFSVLYDTDVLGPKLYGHIDSEVVANNFHGVEVKHTSENLFAHLTYARSLGLMAGIWTVTAESGDVTIGALREDVDQITMQLDADKGRALIERRNTVGYFNAWDMTQGPLKIMRNVNSHSVKHIRLGQVAKKKTVHGTPSLETLDRISNPDLIGGSMHFDSSNREAVDLWDIDANANEGFLVSAVVHFDDINLSNNREKNMAIVSKAEAGGFALELAYDTVANPNTTVLRFGVHVGGKFVYHEYPMTGGNRSHIKFFLPIHNLASYLVTGVYDGNGGVNLYINNRLASTRHPNAMGGVTANDVPILVGAEPQTGGGSRFYLDGKVQQVTILR